MDHLADLDDPEAVLRSTRQRFIATFDERISSLTALAGSLDATRSAEALASLRHVVHRMAGLAGVVGLHTVSAQARELDGQLTNATPDSVDVVHLRTGIARLRQAFTTDTPAPASTAVPPPARTGRLAVVEDDPEQLHVTLAYLRAAGHHVVGVGSGTYALDALRQHRPDLVVLDIDLPGLDGLSIGRNLKSDPQLHGTSVVFVSARAAASDKRAGLTLGADDYLVKPVDHGELQLRIDRILRRRAEAASTVASSALASYETFATQVREHLARSTTGAIALMRTPPGRSEAVAEALTLELRRRDVVGRYDDRHLVVWLPELTAGSAAARLREMFDPGAAEGGTADVFAGVADTGSAGGGALETLMASADDALLDARHMRTAVAVHGEAARPAPVPAAAGTVVIADDDPDVARVVDSQLRAAGYRTVLSFDGRQALDAIRTSAPIAAILDLMMPGLNGFEVLTQLRTLPEPRPRTIVVSARGREADVTRAFDLGADDYVIKPFSPPELIARLTRLVR